jgi:DNA polymerase elongation subunit (family B)
VTADRPPVYGLDIETDTAAGGLDPRRASVLAVAVVTAARDIVLTGDEGQILGQLGEALASLEPGVITTWNGSAFDMPFIADRANIHGINVGLVTRADETLHCRSPLPGHQCSYRASWHEHSHLDAYRLYSNDLKRSINVSCSLKSVAQLVGIPFVDADASRVHELDEHTLRRYVASDARVTRQLALRRWSTAPLFIDLIDNVWSTDDSIVA